MLKGKSFVPVIVVLIFGWERVGVAEETAKEHRDYCPEGTYPAVETDKVCVFFQGRVVGSELNVRFGTLVRKVGTTKFEDLRWFHFGAALDSLAGSGSGHPSAVGFASWKGSKGRVPTEKEARAIWKNVGVPGDHKGCDKPAVPLEGTDRCAVVSAVVGVGPHGVGHGNILVSIAPEKSERVDVLFLPEEGRSGFVSKIRAPTQEELETLRKKAKGGTFEPVAESERLCTPEPVTVGVPRTKIMECSSRGFSTYECGMRNQPNVAMAETVWAALCQGEETRWKSPWACGVGRKELAALDEKFCGAYVERKKKAAEERRKKLGLEGGRVKRLKEKCSKKKKGNACLQLARLHNGVRTDEDTEIAVGYFVAACELGEMESCDIVQDQKRDPMKEFLGAVTLFKNECDAGKPEFCARLGYMYKRGFGVRKDLETGRKLIKSACEKKSGEGCYQLARITKQEGTDLYENACKLKSGRACYYLGYLFHEGDLGRKMIRELREAGKERKAMTAPFKKAAKYYRRGCRLESPNSCAKLAYLHEWGMGVSQSKSKARKLNKKACELGVKRSCRKK